MKRRHFLTGFTAVLLSASMLLSSCSNGGPETTTGTTAETTTEAAAVSTTEATENQGMDQPVLEDTEMDLEDYDLGENISLQSNASNYQRGGWSAPEDWGTWTDGEAAAIAMNVNSGTDLLLNLSVSSLFNKNQVGVYVNGGGVGMYEFVVGENEIIIPKELYPDQELIIEFKFTDIMSPNDLDPLNADERKLGIGVASFYIAEYSPEGGQ